LGPIRDGTKSLQEGEKRRDLLRKKGKTCSLREKRTAPAGKQREGLKGGKKEPIKQKRRRLRNERDLYSRKGKKLKIQKRRVDGS